MAYEPSPASSPAKPAAPPRRSAVDRFLGMVERVGNALPHPATLFALFALAVVLLSGLTASLGLEVTHRATGEIVRPVSLMSVEGFHRMLRGAVTNYTGFAPLGTVMVALIGIGVCESAGLFGAGLRMLVLAAPPRLLTLILVFAGVLSNAASEIGYVLLVPLGGLIFHAAGRHPVVGIAAAFAGVSGGYSANLVLGTVDPLLSGLTQEAAAIVRPDYLVNPACNYYFMVASTFVVTALGTWVTERIVAPRWGRYEGAAERGEIEVLKPSERRGLRFAGWTTLAILAIVLVGIVPAGGFPCSIRRCSTASSPSSSWAACWSAPPTASAPARSATTRMSSRACRSRCRRSAPTWSSSSSRRSSSPTSTGPGSA
jgi:aminobenzoyl-glutamate transport protein